MNLAMPNDTQFPTPAGGLTLGALALPRSDAPAPGLVICHEWWGLNDDMRSLAERFAADGFIALAVDLYAGRVTTEESEAFALANELSTLDAMTVVQGARDFLAGHARCNGKVGVTGFCLGGAMALAAACNVEGLSAALPFYGLPRAEYADWSRARIPIQGHYAKQDAFVTPERAQTAHEAALAAGATFELHFYDAGHAFMRQGDPRAFHAESAALAWSRATSFLHQHLG